MVSYLGFTFAVMTFHRLTPDVLPEYELIDCGNFEKLERFGKFILRRPEPQAVWTPSLSEKDWEKQAHAVFTRKGEKDSESGNWKLKAGMPDRWLVNYKHGQLNFTMRLALTSFKHVGIFPEQAENWDWIFKTTKALEVSEPKVLNLFAYTGGASLAAKAAGADVTHVDSVKPVVTWSRENMEHSKLDGIRWVVEDAFKFVQREVKRGKKYNGIILDPPAYGRGPDGEKWVLEKQINELVELCAQLLEKEQAFLLINLYSMGFSPMIAENLIHAHFGAVHGESAEVFVQDNFKKKLPLGNLYRFVR